MPYEGPFGPEIPPVPVAADIAAAAKKLPKMSMGTKFMHGMVSGLSKSFIFRPLVTAFSMMTMWQFNTLLRRYPQEASNMASRILKLYYDASGAWVTFASSYMEQLTGHKIDPKVIKSLIGKDINLTAKEVSEGIGKEFLTPMLNMIMPGTPDWDKIRRDAKLSSSPQYAQIKNLNPSDGLLGAERFLGVNLQFQLQAWMLHFIGDTVSMGAMKSLKDLPNAISWSYGIGWLSWLVMGTPFRVAIAEPLEKLLNMIYRQKDLTVAQAIDAFNSGYIDSNQYWRIMREAGYEDADVVILKDQGTTRIPAMTLKELLLTNRKVQSEVEAELKRQGYDSKRIESLITHWKHDRADKLINKWASECIDAYEKGLINEEKLREALKAAGYEDIELGKPIDLQVQISNLKREQTIKAEKGKFTKAELRALYIDNLITRNRAVNELIAMHYTTDDAHLLILNWAGKKGKAGESTASLYSELSEWFGL